MVHAQRKAITCHRRALRSVELVLFTVFAVGIAGCGRQPASDQPTSTTAESASPPDRGAAQEICGRFTIAALSTDAAIDRGPADARRRAANQFGTPALVDQLAGEGRDHDWPLLTQHRAHVQVATTPVADDPQTPTDTQAAAGVIAHRVAVGPDGWQHALPGTVAYCSLTRGPDGWKVTTVTFTDLDTGAGTP